MYTTFCFYPFTLAKDYAQNLLEAGQDKAHLYQHSGGSGSNITHSKSAWAIQ